jgi:small subunit ribosomal protein S2
MVSLEQLLDAGVHFGHQIRRWNPKMEPFIYGQRNGIHIIDIVQTLVYLEETKEFLTKQSSQGKTILFVGTKRQVAPLIKSVAEQSDSFYVNQRWLGGMLTNWATIRTCIDKLNAMDKLEEEGRLALLPKKEASSLLKKRDKLEKFFGGIKQMKNVPDIVILIGQPREINAVLECNKLGIRTITILDTNCNPGLADLFIPANDDSIRSVELILGEFTEAILKGKRA